MDKANVIDRLRWQADLSRTPFGRDLGSQEMVDATKATVVRLEKGEDVMLAACRGCGFEADADGFGKGCPNCGCRDFSLSGQEMIHKGGQ